ncbi:hypothetical protein Xbed_02309 [Xenorhabdus beddingii]|uniref:HcpA-like protein n=1 Tax=Xenorhabdus beddingii TaxID=40578 RepID=A0A1Y2SKT8_9GAMM|nr:Hcp family type VI secretion system effector [Xenorhabdus beddingii]OTA19455.1 hypothetical protein Xbed_02309 [Xenorhabdus beddingii]
MANLIYMTVKGKKQGLISQGCGTFDSIGNSYQIGHENEILIYSFQHLMNREQNVQHHPVLLIKPVDKSSPLLAQSLCDNEELECLFNFYRTNANGGLELYYTIRLGCAKLSSIKCDYPHSQDHNNMNPQEVVTISYKDITWNHKTCSTGAYSFWEERIY